MTEDDEIPVTPLPGYRALTQEQLADATKLKQVEERVLREIDELAMKDDIDMRWIAIAATHIQQGFMAANRAIFQPSRIALPEDDEEEDDEFFAENKDEEAEARE